MLGVELLRTNGGGCCTGDWLSLRFLSARPPSSARWGHTGSLAGRPYPYNNTPHTPALAPPCFPLMPSLTRQRSCQDRRGFGPGLNGEGEHPGWGLHLRRLLLRQKNPLPALELGPDGHRRTPAPPRVNAARQHCRHRARCKRSRDGASIKEPSAGRSKTRHPGTTWRSWSVRGKTEGALEALTQLIRQYGRLKMGQGRLDCARGPCRR